MMSQLINSLFVRKKITEDPYQFIYPSFYLDQKQSEYVGFLWQLDHWCFAKGSKDDYVEMKNKLKIKFGKEPAIGDIIWGLMNESLLECDKYEKNDIHNLMSEFK